MKLISIHKIRQTEQYTVIQIKYRSFWSTHSKVLLCELWGRYEEDKDKLLSVYDYVTGEPYIYHRKPIHEFLLSGKDKSVIALTED